MEPTLSVATGFSPLHLDASPERTGDPQSCQRILPFPLAASIPLTLRWKSHTLNGHLHSHSDHSTIRRHDRKRPHSGFNLQLLWIDRGQFLFITSPVNHFSGYGPRMRRTAHNAVRALPGRSASQPASPNAPGGVQGIWQYGWGWFSLYFCSYKLFPK